jgi:hypothetical protein
MLVAAHAGVWERQRVWVHTLSLWVAEEKKKRRSKPTSKSLSIHSHAVPTYLCCFLRNHLQVRSAHSTRRHDAFRRKECCFPAEGMRYYR